MTVQRAYPTRTASQSSLRDPHAKLLESLIEAELLFPSGVSGLYARSAAYQQVTDALGRQVHAWASSLGATTIFVPPVISRATFDRTNYPQSFPDLMGSVHVFEGGNREHGELFRRLEAGGDCSALFVPSEVVLSSAACHALYPMCTGTLPPGGRTFEVQGYCFRHEPTEDPSRQQAFQMHEVVFVGDQAGARFHRDRGLAAGLELLSQLGLQMTAVPANDPFFGRLGTALAAQQRAESLKIEGITPIFEGAPETAVLSANCHLDHFGAPFGIRTASGETAHSACVAFGIDRIAVALFAAHGPAVDAWPAPIREQLWP